jgi:predicted GIY-YIG superfamily endonuclease
MADDCYARTHADGTPLHDQQQPSRYDRPRQRSPSPPPPRRTSGVYVLKLADGCYYVGSSQNCEERIEQHRRGNGSAWTRAHRVLSSQAPLTHVQGNDSAWERTETLELMFRYGIDRVRGAAFAQVVLSDTDRAQIERDICHQRNLCQRCGREGHFVQACYAKSAAEWLCRDLTNK